MGLPIDFLFKAIRCADKSDTITLSINDDNFNTITLSFQSPREKQASTAYDLMLVDSSDHVLKIPSWQQLEVGYQAFVQMPSAEFMHACKCLILPVGSISVTDSGLEFFASGTIGYLNIKPEDASVTMRAPVSMILDLKYVNSVAKVSALFDQVKIGLSTKQPLLAECQIGDKGYIKCLVAPLVIPETEDEKTTENKTSDMKDKDEGLVAPLVTPETEDENTIENKTSDMKDKDEGSSGGYKVGAPVVGLKSPHNVTVATSAQPSW